ncbi:MAG: hypothetical protein HY738_22385 [Bacteroidia bacterium]|nr:hypothetical protein [Bacteroidia bacterium]
MYTTSKDQQQDLSAMIWQSITRLDRYQQMKLLEFINSLFYNVEKKANKLLKYAGCITKEELVLMKTAITDCEKIDNNEW